MLLIYFAHYTHECQWNSSTIPLLSFIVWRHARAKVSLLRSGDSVYLGWQCILSTVILLTKVHNPEKLKACSLYAMGEATIFMFV